jgi:L-aminopeptidase/D-esterase-like protein
MALQGATTAVELDAVSKSFGATKAVSDVSFSVASGSVHALLGENGAGKSTTMKLLSGLIAPDRETLRIDGVPVGRLLEPPPPGRETPAGSCIGVVVTDAPLGTHTLSRLARRVGLGLARTGSVAHDGSGEIFVAVSTTPGAEEAVDVNRFFAAVVDATERCSRRTRSRATRRSRPCPTSAVAGPIRASARRSRAQRKAMFPSRQRATDKDEQTEPNGLSRG